MVENAGHQIDPRSVGGSPERAADRGRAEDLGFDMGRPPSLGDPAVVRGLVQDFATEVIAARADYNADKLSGEQAKQRIQDAVSRYGAIVMGRGEGFSPLPWNSPDRLGQRIRLVVDVAEGADPGEALFLEMARSITDIAVEHENGRFSDAVAKEHLTTGLDSVAEVLLGYPA